MLPHQKLKTESGNEVVLFPLEYMYISQGEHSGYAMDFLGYNREGRAFNCPCYAPVSCSIVYTGNDHNAILWSDDKVLYADGTLDYLSILVAHDELAPVLNTHFNQGDLFYHTGNYGLSTGDHLHMELARGHVKWNSEGSHLENPVHIYNTMYVNDTVMLRGLTFNWKIYLSPVPPTPTVYKKSNFKWVLYSRKLRNKRMSTLHNKV